MGGSYEWGHRALPGQLRGAPDVRRRQWDLLSARKVDLEVEATGRGGAGGLQLQGQEHLHRAETKSHHEYRGGEEAGGVQGGRGRVQKRDPYWLLWFGCEEDEFE